MTIEPTPKAPEVDNALKSIFGVDRKAIINALVCVPAPVGCGKKLPETDFAKSTGGDGLFRDSLSQKEYQISGLCQDCQDSVFDSEEEEASTFNPSQYDVLGYEDRGDI